MQLVTWLLCWRIYHHITWEMRESLVIPFPSNHTWPYAKLYLPKGLPMLQRGSCHGRGGCPSCHYKYGIIRHELVPCFQQAWKKVPGHVTCLGPRCRHTCTRQCCPLLCEALTPRGCARASYSHHSSGLWISLSQMTEHKKQIWLPQEAEHPQFLTSFREDFLKPARAKKSKLS